MTDSNTNALVIEGVSTAYDKANVLENVSLTAASGKITCLLGSNGSGKTTLVRSILGLTPPNKGTIRFGGVDLTGLPTHRVIAAGVACIPEGRRVFLEIHGRGEPTHWCLSGDLGGGGRGAHGERLHDVPAPRGAA